MDPNLISAQPTGFYGWLIANASLIAFFAQIIYWLGMLVLLTYAVAQYKRWVNFQMGVGKSGKLNPAMNSGEPVETAVSEPVKVEEFVE
jgi:hypothetical protein